MPVARREFLWGMFLPVWLKKNPKKLLFISFRPAAIDPENPVHVESHTRLQEYWAKNSSDVAVSLRKDEQTEWCFVINKEEDHDMLASWARALPYSHLQWYTLTADEW